MIVIELFILFLIVIIIKKLYNKNELVYRQFVKMCFENARQ